MLNLPEYRWRDQYGGLATFLFKVWDDGFLGSGPPRGSENLAVGGVFHSLGGGARCGRGDRLVG